MKSKVNKTAEIAGSSFRLQAVRPFRLQRVRVPPTAGAARSAYRRNLVFESSQRIESLKLEFDTGPSGTVAAYRSLTHSLDLTQSQRRGHDEP